MTPLAVGVTGGIGSGKSIVCKIFACMGVPVYNADDRARDLMQNDTQLRSRLVASFGPSIFDERGEINRSLLRSFFQYPEELQKLNAQVHPAVEADYLKWREKIHHVAYTIKEAALLVEAGTHQQLDVLVLVQAPVELRIARVLARDPHRNRANVQHIIERQMKDEEKRHYANHCLVNDDKTPLLPQVLKLHTLWSASAKG